MTDQLIEYKGRISTNWMSSPTFKPDFPPLPAEFSYLQLCLYIKSVNLHEVFHPHVTQQHKSLMENSAVA